jgi:hypothetical protein
MKHKLTIAVAVIVLVASGLVHGFWSERWHPSVALVEAEARVERVPMVVGDWKAETIDTDQGAFRQAGAQRFWTRSYVNTRKNTSILVILMCGRAGRMAVHTPEVCYRGAGYELGRKEEAVRILSSQGTGLGSFWTARFFKPTGLASDLRLFWGWNDGTGWQASANPRWDFGGKPFLYKLYVSHEAPAAGRLATDGAQDFLRQFLPELNKTLMEPSP